jgi:hypothetical protein
MDLPLIFVCEKRKEKHSYSLLLLFILFFIKHKHMKKYFFYQAIIANEMDITISSTLGYRKCLET